MATSWLPAFVIAVVWRVCAARLIINDEYRMDFIKKLLDDGKADTVLAYMLGASLRFQELAVHDFHEKIFSS